MLLRLLCLGLSLPLALSLTAPPPVVLSPLPIVYNYDHCPFCVRVRLALGLKSVKYTPFFLANDDVPTPTALIGKKIAPIFTGYDGVPVGESMDIVKAIDADPKYGAPGFFQPQSDRSDLQAWQGGVKELLRALQRPRYVASGLMPEFQTRAGREAFVSNHELTGYDKKAWKAGEGGLTLAKKLRLYAELGAEDPAQRVEELSAKLVELDALIHCADCCSGGGLSLDDIDLWSRLRSITIVKGVVWPEKTRAYMDNLSELGDVPLYDAMAM